MLAQYQRVNVRNRAHSSDMNGERKKKQKKTGIELKRWWTEAGAEKEENNMKWMD